MAVFEGLTAEELATQEQQPVAGVAPVSQVADPQAMLREMMSMGFGEKSPAFQTALQGATMGFGDELQAGVKALGDYVTADDASLGDLYQSNLEERRRAIQEYAIENPALAAGLNVAGAIPTGLAMARPLLASQFGTAHPLLASGLVSGGIGTLSGIGSGETPQERLERGAIGGTLGFPLGVAGAYGAEQVSNRLVPYLADKLSGMTRSAQSTANNIVRPFLEQSGTRAQLASRARQLGPEATLADVGGAPTQALTQAAGAKNLGLQQKLVKTLSSRARGSVKRLDTSVRKALGTKGREVADTVKQIELDRSAQAGPLYAEAYSQTVPKNTLNSYVQTLDDRIAQSEGTSYARSLTRLRRALFRTTADGKRIVKQDVEALHKVRKDLNDSASSAWTAGKKDLWLDLKKARDEFDDFLMPDSYKQATKIWSEGKGTEMAVSEGRKILSTDVDDISTFIERSTQSERDAYLVGVTRAIRDKLGQTVEGGKVTSYLNKPLIRERVRPVFGPGRDGDQKYAAFLRDIERENIFNATRNQILGNSQTQPRQEAAKIFEDVVTGGIPRDKGDLVGRAVDLLKTNRSSLTPQTWDSLSDTLTKQGITPEFIDQILDTPLRPKMFQMLIDAAQQTIPATPAVTGATSGLIVPSFAQ